MRVDKRQGMNSEIKPITVCHETSENSNVKSKCNFIDSSWNPGNFLKIDIHID